MTIDIRKITRDLKPFSLKKDDLSFEGSFKRVSSFVVDIDMSIKGRLEHNCDGCGDDMFLDIDDKLTLSVSDGVSDSEDIDMIEVFDGKIDFDEICQGEIEAIRCEYHYCQKCINNFKE